ncbi:MAG: glycosyltransferase [Syntrophobacteraceae bacterium]|jgi:glycosyltransferase involved in cell wall biosynthesis|nr:glycosyltransferase [Syntrophobacteraceae bacterium]
MKLPRSVLYVSHTAALKGSAISLAQLILGLDRSRFEPTVVFSKPGYWLENLGERGISCHVLKSRGFLGWRLVSEAKAVMDRARVGLVHLNSAVPFCKYVGIAARMRRTPVVWHIREDPRSKRVRRLKKWIRGLSDRVFVVSSELERFFEGFPVVKVFNGVDLDRFQPGVTGEEFRDRFGIPRTAFVFGIVGTIEERKGTLAFLRAAEVLARSDSDARFAVVGDGMAEDVRKIRDYLSEHELLASRVILTGRLDDIPRVMAGLDVLVLPSLWEGFPRSLIEAMACGRVAIASDVGEIPFILEGGRCGMVVPCGDDSALVQAMARCLSDRAALNEMGRLARERVVSELSLKRHVEVIQNEYMELLSAP